MEPIEVSITFSECINICSGFVICVFLRMIYSRWRERTDEPDVAEVEVQAKEPEKMDDVIRNELYNMKEFCQCERTNLKHSSAYMHIEVNEELIIGEYVMKHQVNYYKFCEFIEVPYQYRYILTQTKCTFIIEKMDEDFWKFILKWLTLKTIEWTFEIGRCFKGMNPETKNHVQYTVLAAKPNRLVSVKILEKALDSGLRTLLVDRQFRQNGMVQTMYIREKPDFQCTLYFDRIPNKKNQTERNEK